MKGLSKKLLTALLALAAALCLTLGLLFAVPENASADTVTPDVTLGAEYLDIEAGVFKGLKDSDTDTVANVLNGKTFSIELPDTVNSIGDGIVTNGIQKSVFDAYSAGLVSIKLPAGLQSIGNYSFFDCTSLQDIAIPASVKTIGDNAFLRCVSLKAVNYAEASSLEKIGASAFSSCSSLTRITVPASVTSIGASAFSGCTAVTSVNYFATKAASASNPFYGIGSANVVIGQAGSGNEIIQIPSSLFRGSKIVSVEFVNINIPLETGIGNFVFEDCEALERVTFTDCSVKEIRARMFSGCSSLSEINLGDVKGLETIGEQAFQNCNSLLTIAIPSTVTQIGNSAFNGCTKLLEVKNDSALVIGNNDNNGGIGKYAKNIYSSASASGGSHFVAVDGYTYFYDDQTALLVKYSGNATVLNLRSSVTLGGNEYTSYKINDEAFKDNTAITAVNIPAAVNAIGDSAFFGCTSLKSITIPSTVNEVGTQAFYGCTSLESAEIEDSIKSLSIIRSNAFANCTSLKSFVVPKSITNIEQSAFEGCTSLASVKFNSTGLTKIESSAFKGCSSLTEVRIPSTVTTLGGSVFSGCKKLEKAYLPASCSTQKDVFADCAEKLIVIAPDSESYNKYSGVENLADYKLTYEIALNLIVGRTDKEESCLYFGVESELPVQEGYKCSVWYSDESYINKVDKDDLNQLTSNPATTEITLYANKIEKPENITAKQDLTYTENGLSISSNYSNLFNNWTANYNSLYKVEVARYYDVAGVEKEVDDKTKITDAGTYYLSILIYDEQSYGQWEEGVSVRIKVNPAQITALEQFEWGVVSGDKINNLDPSATDELVTVYVYDNKPYLEKQYQDNDKKVELDHEDEYEFTVTKSCLSLTGNTYTLVLKGDGNYGGSSQYIDKIVYSGNTGRSWAVYTATAVVILDNNYKLPAGSAATNGVLKNQGITIDYDPTTNEYIITKVWYVITSDGNKLLSEDRTSSYTIADRAYSYKGDAVVPAPVLLHGEGQENNLITYTLRMYEGEWTNEAIAEYTFSHNRFSSYVNAAMPAAYYVLSVSIKDCEYVDGGETKISTGTGISIGEDNPYTLSFTVRKADLSTLLEDNGGFIESYFDEDFITKTRTLYAEYNGEKTFGDTLSVMPILTLKAEQIHPLSLRVKTVWVDEKYDAYYEGFKIVYRIAGDSGVYGTVEDYTNAPYDIGKYTVNYNVFAPSYEDTFNDSSVSRVYTLFIQGVISAPVVDVEYTGKSLANSINFNSRFFDVVYLNDGDTKSTNIRKELIEKNVQGVSEKDTYTEAGAHRVVLMLNDDYRSLARWNTNDLQLTIVENGSYGTYAVFTFAINKATNYTTQRPQLKPWEWGSQPNEPQWKTQFVTEYNFVLVSKDGGKEYYYKPEGDQLGFDKADAGSYWLKPIALGTDNVKLFDTSILSVNDDEWLDFEILKAEIYWSATAAPRIDSWKYGDDKDFAAPSGTLAEAFSELQGSWTNYFCLYGDYIKILEGENVKTYPTLKALQEASEEGYVPAGNYVYVYTLSATESDNYKPWVYPVYFSVLKADNYWEKTPVIHDRAYGDESKLSDIAFESHFGDAKTAEFEYWYIDENGVASPLPNTVKGSELEIGRYEYKVTLKSSANYDVLVFSDYFYVNKADNGWTAIPNVIGWGEGRFNGETNSPVAQSKFGTVFFTVKDADGNVVIERVAASELNADRLNSLGVGTYTIVAEVAGTANYEELYAEAHFAVFEDSVGMTGLIAATAVFAVIAVGLAVAGVILLIRKNKKMEEEFRKMVNSEMNRR